MGFLSDSEGIIDRFIHVDGAWGTHLENSKRFLSQRLSGKGFHNLIVLGSGWLLDFPMEEVAEQVEHIWLYDVVHPAQVVHKMRKYPNVSMVSADITGGAILTAYELTKKFRTNGLKPAPELFTSCNFILPSSCDYVVSLNVLSQLSDLILQYMKQFIPYSEEECSDITRILQQSHIQMLVKSVSCLISDTLEEQFDHAGVLQYSKELVKCPIPRGIVSANWEWQFDPLGEYNQGSKTVSKVIAREYLSDNS